MANKQLVVLRGVVVIRDGKRIAPKIGQPFDFTADEVKELEEVQKRTKVQILRKPINESAAEGDDTEGGAADDNTGKPPVAKPTGKAAAKNAKSSTDDL